MKECHVILDVRVATILGSGVSVETKATQSKVPKCPLEPLENVKSAATFAKVKQKCPKAKKELKGKTIFMNFNY